MRSGAHGIAHVVQGIEHRHQIEVGAGIVLSTCNLEAQIALAVGSFFRVVDRGLVKVDADEVRVLVSVGHDDGRSTVAAADIGHPRAVRELRGRDPYDMLRTFSRDGAWKDRRHHISKTEASE